MSYDLDSPIESIPYLGNRTIQVFHMAGLYKISDLYRDICLEAIQKTLIDMKENDELLKNNDLYWKGLETRVHTVINRVCCDKAKPIEPFYFLCPISWNLMEDPVMTKYGDSFERDVLVKWIKEHGMDMYRQPLKETEIFENCNLRKAIDHFKQHQLRI